MLTLSLRKFIEKVYQIDTDEIIDPSNFYIEWVDFDVEDHEIDEAITHFNVKNNDENTRDAIKQSIKSVKNRAYESSVMNEYINSYLKSLESKIEDDFDHLNDFFTAIEEVMIDDAGELQVAVDWADDTITFSGDIRKLECYIINCINGYGIFHYEDHDDFVYVTGDDIKERIEGHLHWLKYLEEIYGTINSFFRFNGVDDNGMFGDTDYEMDDLEDELKWEKVI